VPLHMVATVLWELDASVCIMGYKLLFNKPSDVF
jgi:hypothetical protein